MKTPAYHTHRRLSIIQPPPQSPRRILHRTIQIFLLALLTGAIAATLS
jgi:hypothetical protein